MKKNKKKSGSKIVSFLNQKANELRNDQNCSTRIPEDSVISIRFSDGHTHHHFPEEETLSKEIVEAAASSLGISLARPKEKRISKKPIIFKNRQALGDILMMTCSIRDLCNQFPDWPVNVATTAIHIWDNNPYLDRSLTKDNAEIIEIGPRWLTNASNRDDRHFANAFRISIEEKLGVQITQGIPKPDIWMTEEECSSPIIDPPYWIIVAGEKGDWTAKTYPFSRWQEVIENYPNLKFVQVGAKEHRHPKLKGDNVIDLIGKTQDRNTGIRDLFRLFYFAEGSMGLVSFQMHLAAAFNMPCVVIAGAREPARFTRYPGHQYLCTDGCLPCASTGACWHCDLEKTCPSIVEVDGYKVPKCVDLIKTEDVIRAIDQYYEGGRLSFTRTRTPTIPNGISKPFRKELSMVKDLEEKKINKIKEAKKTEDLPKRDWAEDVLRESGYEWGGAQITDQDWEFIKETVEKNEGKINTVLEFGPGLSTLLMDRLGLNIVSYETEDKWFEEVRKKNPKLDIRKWNGNIMQDQLGHFDLAIVDGPPGGKSRRVSTRIASEHADFVLIHDAGREWERKWQDEFLKDKFEGPGKGGHRFHLWTSKKVIEASPDKKQEARVPEMILPKSEDNEKIFIESKKSKVFRIFCNSRGDGGAGRSIDYFMKSFIELGWTVQYVFTNDKPSGTHRRCGHPDVIATNDLRIMRSPCDIFMLASDDFVWEFDKPEVVNLFSNINAKRKVMYINFRIGRIGEIPWTQEFDRYLFLNSELKEAFISGFMKTKTFDEMYSFSTTVLSPPTDISEYINNEINYEGNLRIIRHSSQGNSKYAKDFNEKVKRIIEEIPSATIRLMPPPSFLNDFGDRVISHQRNVPPVKDFLPLGNVFWYNLPGGYTEGGPRVLIEAMASGLPIVTGNHSGPRDRVVDGHTGFLCDSFEEELQALSRLNSEYERRKMGEAAKKHSEKEFNPKRWIKEIIGD